MSIDEKMERFIRHTAELRRDIIDGEGDEVTAVVYALSCVYIGECAAQDEGWEKICDLIGEVALSLLVKHESFDLDEAINDILGND